MHKEEILFQPWAVRYCHNHPDKTAKVITVAKYFTGQSHVARPPMPRPQKTPKAYRQLSGDMHDQQLVLLSSRSQRNSHGPRGLDKALRSIAKRSNTSRGC